MSSNSWMIYKAIILNKIKILYKTKYIYFFNQKNKSKCHLKRKYTKYLYQETQGKLHINKLHKQSWKNIFNELVNY